MLDKKLFIQHITNTSRRTLKEQGFLQGPIRNKPYVDTKLKMARKEEQRIRSQGFDSPEAYENREPEIKVEHGPEAEKIDIEHTPGSAENHLHTSNPGFVMPEGYVHMGTHEKDFAGRKIKDSIKVTVDVWRNAGFGAKTTLDRETHLIAPKSTVEKHMKSFDPRGGISGRKRDPDRYLRALPQRYQAGLIPPGDGSGMGLAR